MDTSFQPTSSGADRSTQEKLHLLRENISRVYFGSPVAIDQLLTCLLARGHALIEDVPGVGKTLLANALSRSIDLKFSRIQLTPDLLPTDLLGVSIYDRETGRFEFRRGPIFANIVLADEVNRTPPRTQAAMLEAMNESAVTLDGVRHELERPFMVVATQNPYTFEGTYTLPESELDRFLLRIGLGYADPEAEARVLQERPATRVLEKLDAVLTRDDVLALQSATDEVRVEESLVQYVIELARRTRTDDDVWLGLSTRGTLALMQAARAKAVLAGRDYVQPEDIIDNAPSVCSHRVMLRNSDSQSTDDSTEYIRDLIEQVPSPT